MVTHTVALQEICFCLNLNRTEDLPKEAVLPKVVEPSAAVLCVISMVTEERHMRVLALRAAHYNSPRQRL